MRVHKNWRLVAILILVVHLFAAPACVPLSVDCSQEDTFCVGLVTAFEGIENHGLNQLTWETLKNVQSQMQVASLDHIESIDARDWGKNILYFAEKRYDVVVIVGTGLGEAMSSVAAEYPDTSFIGVDQELDEYRENLATISFPEQQAGFLAGLLAAMVSPAGKIGAVCETSGIEVVWQYCEGFRAGALHQKEEIDVSIVYHESGERDLTFNDPEWGRQEMLALINDGVDTMTGFGGGTAEGAYLAANEKGVLIIGSEEDLYYQLPDIQPWLVTSIIKDPDTTLSSLVVSASRGEPVSGLHAGHISYAPIRMPRFATDREINLTMQDALQKIRSGEIEIDIPENE